MTRSEARKRGAALPRPPSQNPGYPGVLSCLAGFAVLPSEARQLWKKLFLGKLLCWADAVGPTLKEVS